MEVTLKQEKDWANEYVEVHYDPIGWQLYKHDARSIVTAFQQVFESDFRVHCDEEGQEYSTSYDTLRAFLAKANLEENHIKRIVCVIPIHDEYRSVTIDFGKNTIFSLFDKHKEGQQLSLFDPAIQKASDIFHPAHRENHDMIVLRAFDQEFHLGTIYTEVWDQERHFWRTFEGFEQYFEEAPTDRFGFYEYLDKISFFISIDEIRYRVWIYLTDGLSLSSIEIESDETNQPHDFTPIMEELERLILQRE